MNKITQYLNRCFKFKMYIYNNVTLYKIYCAQMIRIKITL